MKALIEIPEEYWVKDDKLICLSEALLCVEERVRELKTTDKQFNYGKELCVRGVKKHFKNAPSYDPIIIPENATNGDVIKAMFPNYKFKDSCGWVNIYIGGEYGESYSFCPDKFWDAPYKGGE